MKPTKTLWRISVATSPEAEDAVAETLGELFGVAAASYLNLETSVSTVSVFRDQKPDVRKVRAEVTARLRGIEDCGLNTGAGTIEIASVKREDWAESWKKHFHPLEIGRDLLVKPSWSKRRAFKNQVVVVLDPGLSFGTGQHPTTSFCLHELVHYRKNGTLQSFLDIGTGSGILAIAAVKLGYQPVHAFDFDPESVRVARANAESNDVLEKIKLTQEDATRLPLRPARRYDLVCANLISNLLVAERKRIIAQLNRGGTLVLAGILQTEFAMVRAAFAELGWILARTEARNEWQSGAFTSEKKD